jgi:Fe-S-cluster containining protein
MPDDLHQLAFDAEQARAAEQLAVDPLRAVAASHRRHDALAEAARSAAEATIACRRGCAWCCQFRVSARAVEVLRLAAWLTAHRPAAEVERVRAQADAHARRLAGMVPERRLRTNLACPLLVDDACSAWEARPLACRAFHATDAEGCRDSVLDPERDDIPPALVPAVDAVSRGHRDGFVAALQAAGHDDALYELNAALAQALGPGPADGAITFPGARFSD